MHPSLLPAFTGLNAPKQALDYGARFAGCTVHFVDDGIDTGPIILQGVVEVLQNDTEETLLTKIHEKEHEILPKAIVRDYANIGVILLSPLLKISYLFDLI